MMSMRQIIDLLSNTQTMNELIYTIRSIPGDIISAQLKQAALDSTTGFKASISSTNLADIALNLDPLDLNQATQLLNDGFENAPSNQQAQKMSNAANRAISSNSQTQVANVLTNLLDTFKMERDDYAQIEQANAIALNKKVAFETGQPECASALEAKAIQGGSRKIKTTQLASRERLDDFALIESTEVDMTEKF